MGYIYLVACASARTRLLTHSLTRLSREEERRESVREKELLGEGRMERRTVVFDAEAGDEHERQGTVWTATSHIVAAVVGSGVLALSWTVAQLGWVVGPLVLLGFSCITYYTSALLADCYRYPDLVHGAVNKEYIDAVRCYLGR